jgi:hypothetical protein
VIVSVMLVAALRTVAASGAAQTWNSDRLKGHHLAADLMAEILDLPYSDPDGAPLFGPELNELLTDRGTLDDVDDYDGFWENVAKRRNGDQMEGYANWSRSVSVAWVSPSDTTTTSLIETNVKRITVTASRGGVPVVRLVALRTNAAPN